MPTREEALEQELAQARAERDRWEQLYHECVTASSQVVENVKVEGDLDFVAKLVEAMNLLRDCDPMKAVAKGISVIRQDEGFSGGAMHWVDQDTPPWLGLSRQFVMQTPVAALASYVLAHEASHGLAMMHQWAGERPFYKYAGRLGETRAEFVGMFFAKALGLGWPWDTPRAWDTIPEFGTPNVPGNPPWKEKI